MTARRPIRVLFLCSENSGRSQIAEALLRHRGGSAFHAASAGPRPARRVHPLAVEALAALGIPCSAQTPKGFEAVMDQRWDLVITLCDRSREECPALPGQPVYADWSMPDPAAVTGNEATRLRAFHEAVLYLRQRITFLSLLPREKLARAALELRGDEAPE